MDYLKEIIEGNRRGKTTKMLLRSVFERVGGHAWNDVATVPKIIGQVVGGATNEELAAFLEESDCSFLLLEGAESYSNELRLLSIPVLTETFKIHTEEQILPALEDEKT